MTRLGIPQQAQCYVITVTYGNRCHFLRRVVHAALDSGVGRVVIVDNASVPESRKAIQELEHRSGGRVVVVYLPENRGSAGGYKAGLKRAVSDPDCDYIWLLDDDNMPVPDALDELLEHYRELEKSTPPDRLALLSLRQDREHLRKVAHGVPPHKVFRNASFMGFHVRDLPSKFTKRLPLKRHKENTTMKVPVNIPFGSYGGLFFHASVVPRIGFPDERFFVYTDDSEYTYRFTRTGGKLFLVPSSLVQDIENSWNIATAGGNAFSRLLFAESDLRVYYAARNSAYFNKHIRTANRSLYGINKWIFLVLLGIFAFKYRKASRFRLIIRAVREGELGHLGRKDGLL
jgi:GT2 family glycosyltransferase